MNSLKTFYEKKYAKLELTSHMLRRIKLTEIAILKYGNKGSILEVGCGTGDNLYYYVNKFNFNNSYCIEIAPSVEMEIKKKGITPIILDVNENKVPLADSSIDVVIFEEVIEHLYNSDLIISEIKRILKKDGILIVSTPNLSSWINRLVLLFGYQPFSHDVSFLGGFGRFKFKNQTNSHIKSFTLKAIIDYIKYFDFDILEIKGVEADGISGILLKLDRVFAHIPSIASHIFLVAKKK
jgi:SAM-dependent methyltransferase